MFYFVELCLTSLKLGKRLYRGEFISGFRAYCIPFNFTYIGLNKLQHKCSQLFLVQNNVLYNILKVSRNLVLSRQLGFS